MVDQRKRERERERERKKKNTRYKYHLGLRLGHSTVQVALIPGAPEDCCCLGFPWFDVARLLRSQEK